MATGDKVRFVQCAKVKYDELAEKDKNTLYFTDDLVIYKGSTPVSLPSKIVTIGHLSSYSTWIGLVKQIFSIYKSTSSITDAPVFAEGFVDYIPDNEKLSTIKLPFPETVVSCSVVVTAGAGCGVNIYTTQHRIALIYILSTPEKFYEVTVEEYPTNSWQDI